MLISEVYLIRVLSFIEDLRSGVSMCPVVWVGGVGTWWLPSGGIRASQGTFSSFLLKKCENPLQRKGFSAKDSHIFSTKITVSV